MRDEKGEIRFHPSSFILHPYPRGAINTSAIGLILLAVTIIASLIFVIRNVMAIEKPDRTTIRIAHWQLEAGYREAMDKIIADYEAQYEKTHGRPIKVIQMPVTEKVYAQWINTQMISGTAPDMVEMGMSSVMMKDENTARYFISLGDEVGKPNPHNKGTSLEGVPWKETFIDGMRGGYRDTLQDYYMVPTTLVGVRLFVNVTLLDQLGLKVPTSFGELIDDCQKVREYSFRERGGAIVPLVSCYNHRGVISPYQIPFMASYESALDTNLDGTILPNEAYYALRSGKISFDSPNIKAYFQAMKLLCDQMQKGFSSMDRQQAQFLFSNGNAAFLSTGSWDARGIYLVTDQKGYKVKVIDSPLPKPGEPFSQYIIGRGNEASAKGSGCFGIYKGTQHRKEAMDFLQYLTSKEGNEKFNDLAEWPPIVLGSKPAEIMKPFMPNPVGYTSYVNFSIGSKLGGVYDTELTAYLQGEKTWDEFTAAYMAAATDPEIGGDWAAWYDYDKVWRDCRSQDRLLARDALDQLMDPSGFTQTDQTRYRRTLLQQVRRNNGRDLEHRFEIERGMPLKKF